MSQDFPEPSPLEIVVSSSEQDIIAPPAKAGKRDEFVPLFPLVLDDSDEIINSTEPGNLLPRYERNAL